MKQLPGRTSKIQLGKSVLTLQTEIRGQPLQVVTVVDVAGRVVHTEINTIPSEVIDRGQQALLDYSSRAHGRVEVEVREALDRKLQSKRSKEPAAEQRVQGARSREQRDRGLAVRGSGARLHPR